MSVTEELSKLMIGNYAGTVDYSTHDEDYPVICDANHIKTNVGLYRALAFFYGSWLTTTSETDFGWDDYDDRPWNSDKEVDADNQKKKRIWKYLQSPSFASLLTSSDSNSDSKKRENALKFLKSIVGDLLE